MSVVQAEIISQQNYDFPIHLLVNWQDLGTPDNNQEDDESTTDPAGWLAIQLRDLVDSNVINVIDVQRIINFGFEGNKYSPEAAQSIIESIFEGVLDNRNDKEEIINFFANNIFISNANLINIRNGYKNVRDIGYLYSVEDTNSISVEGEIIIEEKYIMFGFGQLTEDQASQLNIAKEGMSPLMWRILIDPRTEAMTPIRYPGGQRATEKYFTVNFFHTEEAVLYALIENQANDLLTSIVMDDLLGIQIIGEGIPQINLGDVSFIRLEIGKPIQSNFEGVIINGAYIEVSLRLSGMPENWSGNFLFGHGIPEDQREMINNLLGGKQILEPIGETVEIPNLEDDKIFSQDYIYRIPVVFINQILQSAARDHPELLAQALGTNSQKSWGTELLVILALGGSVLGVGFAGVREILKRFKSKSDEGFEIPETLNSAINYLNRVVGVSYINSQTVKKSMQLSPNISGLNTDQINNLLAGYISKENSIELNAARSLINLYKLTSDNPIVLAELNRQKRVGINPTTQIKKTLLNHEQVRKEDLPGSFKLSELTLEMIEEVLLAIPERLKGNTDLLEEFEELEKQLKTLNAQSYSFKTLSKLRAEIRAKIIEVRNETSDNSTKPEQPVKAIAINGEPIVFTKRNIKISGGIEIPRGAVSEIQVVLNHIKENFDGQPNIFFDPNNSKRPTAFISGRANQVPRTTLSPSEEFTFIYTNQQQNNLRLKVTYRLDTDDFTIENYVESSVNIQHSDEIKVERVLESGRGESPDPIAIAQQVINILNGQKETISPDLFNNSQLVRQVQDQLASMMNQVDIVYIDGNSKKPSGIKFEDFKRSVTRHMIQIASGVEIMTSDTNGALVKTAKDWIERRVDDQEVTLLESSKAQIGQLRIHIGRVRIGKEEMFRISIVGNDHNSAR